MAEAVVMEGWVTGDVNSGDPFEQDIAYPVYPEQVPVAVAGNPEGWVAGDVHSAGANPLDISYPEYPDEAPQAPPLVLLGWFASDPNSGAAVADPNNEDIGFPVFPDAFPLPEALVREGWQAGDLDSAGARPLDIGYPDFADQAPEAPELVRLGWFAADIHSGVPPADPANEDISFPVFPHEPATAEALVLLGWWSGDLDSAGANPLDISYPIFPGRAPTAEELVQEGWFTGDVNSGAAAGDPFALDISYPVFPFQAPEAEKVVIEGYQTPMSILSEDWFFYGTQLRTPNTTWIDGRHITLLDDTTERFVPPGRGIWNVIPPVRNLVADPYQADFGDWVQTDSQGAGAQVRILLPLITKDSKGMMVGSNSSSELGPSASYFVKVSGTDTLNKTGTGVLQTVRGGALIFVSDGISNWMRYFTL